MNRNQLGEEPDKNSQKDELKNDTTPTNHAGHVNKPESDHPLAAEIRHWTANIPISERDIVANCLKFKWAFAEKIQTHAKMLYGENRLPLAQQIKLDFEHVKSAIREYDMHCDKRCYEDDEAEILENKRKRIETLGNNLADLISGRCWLPIVHLTSHEQEGLKTKIQRKPPIKIIEMSANKKAPCSTVSPKPPVAEVQDAWISYDEAADLLEMTKSTVSKWTSQGRFIDNGCVGPKRKLSRNSVILAKQQHEDQQLNRFGKKKY